VLPQKTPGVAFKKLTMNNPSIFINLPVTDLKKAVDFYQQIGFVYNPVFSDDTAACLLFEDVFAVMLLTHEKLRQFTTKDIINAKKTVGVINCISLNSPAALTKMGEAVIAAGAVMPEEPKDYGFMQQRSFEDPDGNLWEIIYMDMSKFPGKP